MYKVDYHKRVIKFLSKKDYKFKEQILDIFDDIAKDPYSSEYDIKPYKYIKLLDDINVSKLDSSGIESIKLVVNNFIHEIEEDIENKNFDKITEREKLELSKITRSMTKAIHVLYYKMTKIENENEKLKKNVEILMSKS